MVLPVLSQCGAPARVALGEQSLIWAQELLQGVRFLFPSGSIAVFCFHLGIAASALPFTVQLSAEPQRSFAVPVFFFLLFSHSFVFHIPFVLNVNNQ